MLTMAKTPPIIHVDFETQSLVNLDLTKVGIVRYLSDPDTRVLCMAYQVDRPTVSGPIKTWFPWSFTKSVTGDPDRAKAKLLPAIFRNGPFILAAHNVDFEYGVFQYLLKDQHWEIAGTRCTMDAARSLNLPASLGNLAARLAVPVAKDDTGRLLMLKLTKGLFYYRPPKPKLATRSIAGMDPALVRSADREDWATREDVQRASVAASQARDLEGLAQYCVRDVEVEIAVGKVLGPGPATPPPIRYLDRKINARGISVDVPLARAIIKMSASGRKARDAELLEVTGGIVKTASEVGQLTAWLKTQGYPFDSLAQGCRDSALGTEEIRQAISPAGIRALEIRALSALGSLAKYQAMDRAQVNGRLYNLFQFNGASQTGRWAGRLVQFQNLPRLKLTDTEISLARALFVAGEFDAARSLLGPVEQVAKQLIRPTFYSEAGLTVADFAQIEARVLAWLADAMSLVVAFRRGLDVYAHMAARIHGTAVEDVTKDMRQLGKATILGAGFGLGGPGFANQLAQWGIVKTEAEAQQIIRTYRDTFPDIPKFWFGIQAAWVKAANHVIAKPDALPLTVRLMLGWGAMEFCGTKSYGLPSVSVRLPSGRLLWYRSVRSEQSDFGPGHTYLRSTGERDRLWSGLLTENIVQAIANDLLRDALLRLDAEGLEVIGHVHDEVLVRGDSPENVARIQAILDTRPDWAEGLPLSSEVAVCSAGRYTK